MFMARPASQMRRRALRLLFRLINSVVGSILRSPLHRLLSGKLALLTFYGHKSGRRYTTPVGYARALGVSLGSDGLPRREDVARIRQKGHVVVRIELDP